MKRYTPAAIIILLASLVITSLLANSVEGTDGQTQWSPRLKRKPKVGDYIVNGKDGYVMVWIPEGEFQMGSSKGDKDEQPRHRVEVDGFWLGKYEVTNEQYSRFIKNANPWHRTPFMNEKEFNNPKQPVTGIRFYDALAYCEWSGLRLPTEAEWEYAAGGGIQAEYPTENGTIGHDMANFLGKKMRDRWMDTPAPVGSFPPNPFGLHDMAGNVWEWTSSLYQFYPYKAGDGREDTTARDYRVLRGGSWGFPKHYCKTTHRKYFDMHLRYDYAGMRLARSYREK